MQKNYGFAKLVNYGYDKFVFYKKRSGRNFSTEYERIAKAIMNQPYFGDNIIPKTIAKLRKNGWEIVYVKPAYISQR